MSLELDGAQQQRFLGVDLDTGEMSTEERDSLDIAVDVNGRLTALQGNFGRPEPSEYDGVDAAADLSACTGGGLTSNLTGAIDVNDLQPGQVLCVSTDQRSAVALLVRQRTHSVYDAALILDAAVSRR
ncbi:hypothetical protein [Geodermatophilus sp. CPCC 205506]|uniref:hypothetical protein n=1 Tax=Geodermatophilus sp. CPCC 205506 TaxID=2936596 RepID=UPI003EED36AA